MSHVCREPRAEVTLPLTRVTICTVKGPGRFPETDELEMQIAREGRNRRRSHAPHCADLPAAFATSAASAFSISAHEGARQKRTASVPPAITLPSGENLKWESEAADGRVNNRSWFCTSQSVSASNAVLETARRCWSGE